MKNYIPFLLKIVGGLSLLGILSFSVSSLATDESKAAKTEIVSRNPTSVQSEGNISKEIPSIHQSATKTTKQSCKTACSVPSRIAKPKTVLKK
jgi:hypothetical protein